MDTRTLIERLSQSTLMKREDIQKFLNDFEKLLSDVCIDMDTLLIPGFGQFEPKKRKERISVHPASGKRLLIPPKIVIGFHPSAVLKSKLSGQAEG